MATQADELVTAEGARKLFDRYRDTAGGGVVLADVVTSGHMTSIPLSDSVRNYRVVEVFTYTTSGSPRISAYARIVGAAVNVGVQINFSSAYGNYSFTYQFTSETALGLMPGYAYITDGTGFLIIGYNFE